MPEDNQDALAPTELSETPPILGGEKSVGAGVEWSGAGTLASPSAALKDVDSSETLPTGAESEQQPLTEQPSSPTSVSSEPQVSPEQTLPPEARGETNGGPLGCCLGVAVGLMVSLPVAVIGRIYANPLIPVFHSALTVLILLRIAMGISGLAGAILFGYFGWRIGKKLYREYEPPVVKYRHPKRRKTKAVRNI